MTYHVNHTYAKLAPDSILNKKIKEMMRYTGDTGHPQISVPGSQTPGSLKHQEHPSLSFSVKVCITIMVLTLTERKPASFLNTTLIVVITFIK